MTIITDDSPDRPIKKEVYEQSAKFIGILKQELIDALEKKFRKIQDDEGIEGAYWRFTITLKMEELMSDFKEVLKTTVIESKDVG